MCDDNEQYSRRSCIRINGIEYQDGEKTEDVAIKIKECYEKIGIPYDATNIDRTHRIGKSYVDKVSGKMVKQIIVKFRSWSARTKFFQARPKSFENGIKKPGPRSFGVTIDLTKRRYALLNDAKGIIDNYPEANYAFADVNCSLAIRLAIG